MSNVYIVSAKRTPLGAFGGAIAGVPATELGIAASIAAIKSSNLNSELIDEVYFGQVVQANSGQAPARQVALGSGLPQSTPSTTINKVCASGMKAIMLGAQSIEAGQNNAVLCGGMENMSLVPHYLPKARYGYGYGNGEIVDGLVRDGLANVYDGQAMGCFGDTTAAALNITREQQDAYTVQSYNRAAQAWQEGAFDQEVCGVSVKDRKGNITIFDHDQEYKNVIFDKIPSLRPVFSKDGTVTAANASTINDGASALVLASQEIVEKYKCKPLAKVISYADAAQAPEWFTLAPTIAAQKALDRAGLTISDIDYFEVNEAFAVVALAFIRHYNLHQDKVNVFGGAVALGHPLGCSGARIVTTLTSVLHKKSGRYGLAAICNGGGGASAIIIERV